MSKSLSYSYFQKQYMQRVAAGELFIPEPESPAVDMFIAELNKSPKGDADFSIYKLDDIEWGDFLGDIFSSEEYRDHTETGFEYRAIVEAACAQTLRTFIGKIKKVETKLALLKHFMSDDFRQNVLTKGYCAYGSSADMIQLQCAKLMGEINRSLHGEVAPDLANLPDDYGEDEPEPASASKSNMSKGHVFNYNGVPCLFEVYELPQKQFDPDDYFDDEHEPIAKLLRQGKMIHALDKSIECTIDIVRSFYENVKADDEGKLIFSSKQCDPIDVTIYRFHQQMIDRFETIDAKGAPIHKPDYQFFLANYKVLLELKKHCQLYISPHLWNDQATKYVQQAYYLQYELRRRHYDVEYSYVYYEIFKLGYESPLYKPKGGCANDFLKLIVQIRDEFNLARKVRKQAEDYAVSFPDMPGDRPLLFDTYNANRLLSRPADPVLWLSMDMSMSTNQIDKRIQWLETIQFKEADTLSNEGVSPDEIGLVKYGCKLLTLFYRRLKGIILHDGEASSYLRSMKPEDRVQAEFNVYFMNITAEEMFAVAQAMCDGNHRQRNIPTLQALLELPDYTDKLLSYSLYECLLYLCTATRFRQSYLQNKMVANYSELKINEFLGDYFRIYTDLRKEQLREAIFLSKPSFKKPADMVCLTRLYEESLQCITDLKENPKAEVFVLNLCELFLDYLKETYPDIFPNVQTQAEPVTNQVPVAPTENISAKVVEDKPAPMESMLFRTDKSTLQACWDQFVDIITTSQQKVLSQIWSAANSFYFNPNTFGHKELAKELNRLQKKFVFNKADIDAATKRRI